MFAAWHVSRSTTIRTAGKASARLGEEVMATTNQKIHGVIHTASLGAAAVGAGMAQIPGSDAPVIAGIQTTMIIAISEEYGVPLTKIAAADLLLTFAATTAGRGLSQVLVGWIPGWGNAVNASTAAALTEAVGWAADAYFESNRRQLSA